MSKSAIGALAAILALAGAGDALAADAAVTFNGCPTQGVEIGCVVIGDGTNIYNISNAVPPVQFNGLGISGSGTVSTKVSTCMQGKVLVNISYAYTKQKCPIPPRRRK